MADTAKDTAKLTDGQKFTLIIELEKHPSIRKRGVYRKNDKKYALEEISRLLSVQVETVKKPYTL